MRLDPAAAGFSEQRLERITDHLRRSYIEPGKIAGCQVMVARHGVTAYFRSFGSSDRERNRPMAQDTIFRLYSMTKPITSVALMMLYEEGRFQLNDPVSRFIPSWRGHRVWVEGEGEKMVTRPPASPMTMRHVLSHTAGLTYGNMLDTGASHPVDEAYARAGVSRAEGETLRSFADALAGALGAGDYYWGGAASTIFWVDPVEDLFVIFMTQLMPSATFDFRGQLKNIIYSAIED